MTHPIPFNKRLLAGTLIVSVQWILWLIVPMIAPELLMLGVAGGALGAVFFMIWWLFFSRFPGIDRWGSLLLMAVSTLLCSLLLHESIETGNMGLMFYMYTIPNLCLAVILAILLGRKLKPLVRRVVMAVLIIMAPGIFVLLRSDGLNGEGRAMLNWRWAGTDESRLLAAGDEAWFKGKALEESGEQAEWPGFRGPDRNSVVKGSHIGIDWESHPPELLWKQPVGPGCSSFAISGDRVYTQEQRGEEELVTCYEISTGGLIWKHSDEARFYDSHAGAGPRATPTLEGGRVYTLGGTGILNVLDASTGKLIWSRPAAMEEEMEALTWGFCASPLVTGNAVVIALAGKVLAYEKDKGELLWKAEDGGGSYSSPQLFHIDGIPQVLFMSKMGCSSLDPASGAVLWTHEWEISDRILQPALTDNGALLLCAEMKGFRSMDISRQNMDWKLEKTWTNENLKLNFNDQVIHKGHAYVFDGPSLACVDLETGERTWKGKRYRGWTLLLNDQDLLLVLGEKGDLALVEARPDNFSELASIKAIEGRTWNHPAMAGDILLVRNSREMAAFRLPPG